MRPVSRRQVGDLAPIMVADQIDSIVGFTSEKTDTNEHHED